MVLVPVFDGFELIANRLRRQFGEHRPDGFGDEYLRHPTAGDRVHLSVRGALLVGEIRDDGTNRFGRNTASQLAENVFRHTGCGDRGDRVHGDVVGGAF